MWKEETKTIKFRKAEIISVPIYFFSNFSVFYNCINSKDVLFYFAFTILLNKKLKLTRLIGKLNIFQNATPLKKDVFSINFLRVTNNKIVTFFNASSSTRCSTNNMYPWKKFALQNLDTVTILRTLLFK